MPRKVRAFIPLLSKFANFSFLQFYNFLKIDILQKMEKLKISKLRKNKI
jgi:hypothetical protein